MSHVDQPAYAGPNAAREFVARAFGAENRARLLARYFHDHPLVTPGNAWQHVYRLLLWIDCTTALAHCYESDKAQPGRAWYGRSLAFHDWVSNAFDLSPADLGEHIDWLFSEAVKDLAHRVLAIRTPGFYPPAPNEKAKRVDLALAQDDRRTLISAKWSIRADREEQFQSDFEAYARLESAGQDFAYTLITNEFDAARLRDACERRRPNAPLFTQVVHVNPDAVLATYGKAGRGSAKTVYSHVDTGRLMSLRAWLEHLAAKTPTAMVPPGA